MQSHFDVVRSTWLRRGLLFALLTALLSYCSPPVYDHMVVVVNVGNVLPDVQKLEATAILNGKSATEGLTLTQTLGKFAVQLPYNDVNRGTLEIAITAFSAEGCKVASGRGATTLEPGRYQYELEVSLTILPAKLCTVTVLGPSNGKITSQPLGIDCGGSCTVDLPYGQNLMLTLQSLDPKKTAGTLWSGDCTSSSTLCAAVINRPLTIRAELQSRLCTKDNWCWWNPVLHGRSIQDVAVSGDGTAWAVGDGGTIIRCVGELCNPIASGTSAQLWSVALIDGNTAWVAGANGTVLKCLTSGCSALNSGTTQVLYSVAALDANTAWAVGISSILKCSGAACVKPPGFIPYSYRAVWASDADNAWGVGYDGANAIVVKCSAAGCTTISSGTGDALVSIWGSDPNNVWTVGGASVFKCSSSSCASISLAGATTLASVSGSDASNVWIAGSSVIAKCSGNSCTPISVPLGGTPGSIAAAGPGSAYAFTTNGVYKCNANSCTSIFPTSLQYSLYAIASNTSTAWVIGNEGDILKCSDTGCANKNTSVVSAGHSVNQIWGIDADNIWAGTNLGHVLRCGPTDCFGIDTGTTASIVGIWAADANDVWAIQGQRVLKCSASQRSCQQIHSVTASSLSSIIGRDANNVWTVGFKGGTNAMVFKCTSSGCVEISPTGPVLNKAWLRDNNSIWAVGQMGKVFYCDSATCTGAVPVGTPVISDLVTVHSAGPNLPAAVGSQSSAVLSCLGNTCTRLDTPALAHQSVYAPTSMTFWTVNGNAVFECSFSTGSCTPFTGTNVAGAVWNQVGNLGGGAFWVLSQAGTSMLRCQGTSCSPFPVENVFKRIFATAQDNIWAVGDSGGILRYTP